MTAHLSLQRLVVRLLYDPALVDSLHSDPGRVLGPLSLPEGTEQWLLSVDRRAWGIDSLRRSRTLFTLLEEFPASTTLGFQQPDAATRLDRFFSSHRFHHAIQNRASLAPTFGDWWRLDCNEGHWPRETTCLLQIETCIAQLRRAINPDHGVLHSPGPGEVMMHPGVGLVRLPTGSLNLYSHVLNAMGPSRSLEPIIRGEVSLSSLPAVDLDQEETLLVDPFSDNGGVGSVDDSLADLLRIAKTPIAREALFDGMLTLGAEPGEQMEILEGLMMDGLLMEN